MSRLFADNPSSNVRTVSISTAWRTLIIANPQSANGTVGRRWEQLRALISEQLGTVAHRLTACPGDGTRLAQDAATEGYQLVVAMGGDGTINEVANGLLAVDAALRPALGILPCGTGGDLRRSLALPAGVAAAAQRLRGTNTTEADVGCLTYTRHDGATATRFFLNIASFGLSGLVDHLVAKGSKVLGGRATFAWATLRALWQYTPARVALALDDRPATHITPAFVAVANGQYFGGGMHIAPQALLNDGAFDVVVVDGMARRTFVRHLPRVYRGRHLSLPEVTVTRATRIAATAEDGAAIFLDVDGEALGRLPATFRIVPRALRLKVGP